MQILMFKNGDDNAAAAAADDDDDGIKSMLSVIIYIYIWLHMYIHLWQLRISCFKTRSPYAYTNCKHVSPSATVVLHLNLNRLIVIHLHIVYTEKNDSCHVNFVATVAPEFFITATSGANTGNKDSNTTTVCFQWYRQVSNIRRTLV